MPLKRLEVIIPGALNTANSPVQSGQYEPITGLELPSGLVAGDYFDMTETEANNYSNSSGGVATCHCGRYMWVQMDSSAVITGNGKLTPGQILWWKTPGSYIVTNVEPTGATKIAGFFLNTNNTGLYPVTPGNYFFMQALAPGRASIQMRATISNTGPAVGDSVFAAGAGAGADASLADDIGGTGTPPTLANIALYIGRFIGVAETAPANGSLTVVEIQKAGPSTI